MADTKKPKLTDAERLAALKQKKAALESQIAKLTAKEKAEERKLDARRKIIVGGAVMAHAKIDAAFGHALRQVLKAAVTREADRDIIRDLIE